MVGSEQSFPEDFYVFDSSNHKQIIGNYVQDLRINYNRSFKDVIQKLNNRKIIITGSPWSINSAKLLLSGLNEELRVSFTNGYAEQNSSLLKKDSLLIAILDSENNEEAVSWIKQAGRNESQILLINFGERKEFSYPCQEINVGVSQPRKYSVFVILGVLLKVFEDLNLISGKTEEVQRVVDFIRNQDLSGLAVDLSQKLHGVIPIIYATTTLKEAGKRFKMLLNVNAKSCAFFNEVPGADYFELEGFKNKNAVFHVVLLSNPQDLSRLRKKFSLFKECLQKENVDLTEINIKGEGLVKIVMAVLLGEWVSYYLALRYRQDPGAESLINDFEKDMGPLI